MNDIVIVFSFVEESDEGEDGGGIVRYPSTHVVRLDYEGSYDEFMIDLKNLKGVVHREVLVAEGNIDKGESHE